MQQACAWLRSIVAGCLDLHAGRANEFVVEPLDFEDGDSWFATLVGKHNPTYEEFVVLMVGLISHIDPGFFTGLIAERLPSGGDFPEFGGVKAANHRGILPTGETAQFILAGNNLDKRLEVQRILSGEHWFAKKRILWLESVPEGEPVMSGRLVLDPEIVEQLSVGVVSKPRFSGDFPAEHIETAMEWSDLVLNPGTLRQIHEIENWIKYSDTLLDEWGMKKKIKPGYRALFYGPPGTGKTLTAMLLGKHTGKDVFRIDLSRIMSKYIGETEKNLSRLFDKAEHKNWILFFDEADALFGKRTEVRDSHDRYANQEVAYLLQRVESYNGLVVLASNQRSNIDVAFVRRFQSIIHFPTPTPEERYEIWQKMLPEQISLADDVDLVQVAARYELTGAGILNVTHYCAIEALADESRSLDLKRLEAAIMREFVKEGKVV
jgi:hypothetical protein